MHFGHYCNICDLPLSVFAHVPKLHLICGSSIEKSGVSVAGLAGSGKQVIGHVMLNCFGLQDMKNDVFAIIYMIMCMCRHVK